MKDIAVIIPIYKAHDTIKYTLCSIGMQRAVSYKCYLVVDGEKQGAYDYLKEWFDLEILYMEKNGGPAVARQYGIDYTNEKLISFIDADDTYLSSLALYHQYLPFKQQTTAMVSSSFAQENKDHTLKIREKDTVWMHGKMYRRQFIDKYNIRFNKTRANEDVGFNTQCQCYANEQEDIHLSKQITYLWQWRDNSIVRADNQSYVFNESVDGYVINKIYAFERVLEHKEINDDIKYLIVTGQMYLFTKYLIAKAKFPKRVHHINKWARKYYQTLYKLVDQEYIDKIRLDKAPHYEQYIKWNKTLA